MERLRDKKLHRKTCVTLILFRHNKKHIGIKLKKVDITAAVEKTKKLLENEREISPALKASLKRPDPRIRGDDRYYWQIGMLIVHNQVN